MGSRERGRIRIKISKLRLYGQNLENVKWWTPLIASHPANINCVDLEVIRVFVFAVVTQTRLFGFKSLVTFKTEGVHFDEAFYIISTNNWDTLLCLHAAIYDWL